MPSQHLKQSERYSKQIQAKSENAPATDSMSQEEKHPQCVCGCVFQSICVCGFMFSSLNRSMSVSAHSPLMFLIWLSICPSCYSAALPLGDDCTTNKKSSRKLSENPLIVHEVSGPGVIVHPPWPFLLMQHTCADTGALIPCMCSMEKHKSGSHREYNFLIQYCI